MPSGATGHLVVSAPIATPSKSMEPLSAFQSPKYFPAVVGMSDIRCRRQRNAEYFHHRAALPLSPDCGFPGRGAKRRNYADVRVLARQERRSSAITIRHDVGSPLRFIEAWIRLGVPGREQDSRTPRERLADTTRSGYRVVATDNTQAHRRVSLDRRAGRGVHCNWPRPKAMDGKPRPRTNA